MKTVDKRCPLSYDSDPYLRNHSFLRTEGCHAKKNLSTKQDQA